MPAGRVSIKDVAKASGVSPAAVSRVLNNSDYVSDDKRERVMDAVRRLGYRPNVVARSLVKSETRTIGLCLPYLNSPFISNLMDGVEAKSMKHGYDVFICHTRNDPDVERKAIARMLDRQVEGFIIVPTSNERHYFSEVTEAAPTIFLMRKPKGVQRNLICAADYQAARRSFSLLLDKGHRDIGVIGGPRGLSTVRERWRAIQELLEERGVRMKPSRMVDAPLDYEASHRAAKALLGGKNPPTAVYVMHHWASAALIRLVYELRLRLPDDLSVVFYESFEDGDLASPLRIATNIFPAREFGAEAVSQLHALISGRRLYMDKNIEIEETFIPHESVRDM